MDIFRTLPPLCQEVILADIHDDLSVGTVSFFVRPAKPHHGSMSCGFDFRLVDYRRIIVHVVPLVVLLATLPFRTESPTGLSNLATMNFLSSTFEDSVFFFIKRLYLSS
jgi:hypothetical protein